MKKSIRNVYEEKFLALCRKFSEETGFHVATLVVLSEGENTPHVTRVELYAYNEQEDE